MNTINPALASSSSAGLAQSANTLQTDEARVNEQSQVNSTNSGNTTVTLSDQARQLIENDLNLAANQTVQNSDAVENQTLEANQTTNQVSQANSTEPSASSLIESE